MIKTIPGSHYITVRVVRGYDIACIDLLSGKVNPYVALQTGYEYSWNTHSHCKTSTVLNSRNPDWGSATFNLGIKNAVKDQLQVTLWDRNTIGSDEMIGSATVVLQNLPQGIEVIQRVTVTKARKPKGDIELAICLHGFGAQPQVIQTTVQTQVIQQSPQQPYPVYSQPYPPQPYPGQPVYATNPAFPAYAYSGQVPVYTTQSYPPPMMNASPNAPGMPDQQMYYAYSYPGTEGVPMQQMYPPGAVQAAQPGLYPQI